MSDPLRNVLLNTEQARDLHGSAFEGASVRDGPEGTLTLTPLSELSDTTAAKLLATRDGMRLPTTRGSRRGRGVAEAWPRLTGDILD
jgi:hypothetical protein